VRVTHNPSTRVKTYLSWKIEIGRDWYRSQIGRRLRGKSENVYSGTRTLCLFDRQKVRVPEYTYSLLPINLVKFGFCTNLVRFRSSSLNKLISRADLKTVWVESRRPTGRSSQAGGFGRFHKKSSDFAPDFQNPDFCPRLCARLWRRVQERWAKNRGSTAKHGPRKPSVRDCAGFWRAAMASSVCGEGARPPWSREKTLAPDFFGQPAKPSAAQKSGGENRECGLKTPDFCSRL